MAKSIKKIKQVCKCENCGNEAEMVVTCTLPQGAVDGSSSPRKTAGQPAGESEPIKGTATCSHCGNEADMWVSI